MSLQTPLRPLTLDEWDRFCDEHEDAYELVGGIPAYLVIETGGSPADPPRLTLFDRFEAGLDGTPRYADPAGDGAIVTLQIGAHTLTLTAADLTD
ncbi:hypothetical protein BJY21_001038 [Kineosphaera limosa]|nr:hypothetical protein [Kineosphaera limosa]NYD99853.1 hypothetical protein [Kineosphaera limosa]